MNTVLTTIDRPATMQHRYSIIWLHGLGADGHDFESIVPELALQADDYIRFIFPNAPIQAVTINGGMRMRSWYDILERSLVRRVDEVGIQRSVAAIETLIDQQIQQGIPSTAIIIAGFSQGGLIALEAGLRYPHRLAGVIALSTYLPTIETLKTAAAIENQSLPIFMAHGTFDSVVNWSAGKMAYTALTQLGYRVQWQDYAMDHAVCIDEVNDIADFINAIFPI
ncbi:MAG: hypothetical protein RL637_1083 [Pseudomonadota bacterium]|jgi:phospholipase/carboxylesterase